MIVYEKAPLDYIYWSNIIERLSVRWVVCRPKPARSQNELLHQ